MDPVIDSMFMHIAKEGIVAKLPNNWKAYLNPANNIFYEEIHTQYQTFEHPLDQYYKN